MFLKLSEKCPDVRIRRKPNQSDHIVRINGRIIPPFLNAAGQKGDWSRTIHIDEQSECVVKIDTYSFAQCRNEAVVWSEVLREEDKKFFAPVLGIGTTSMFSAWKKRAAPIRVGYFIVQELIVQEIYETQNRSIPHHLYREAEKVAESYDIGDITDRQMKVDIKGRVKIHDYGAYRGAGAFGAKRSGLQSDRFPENARTFQKKLSGVKI